MHAHIHLRIMQSMQRPIDVFSQRFICNSHFLSSLCTTCAWIWYTPIWRHTPQFKCVYKHAFMYVWIYVCMNMHLCMYEFMYAWTCIHVCFFGGDALNYSGTLFLRVYLHMYIFWHICCMFEAFVYVTKQQHLCKWQSSCICVCDKAAAFVYVIKQQHLCM